MSINELNKKNTRMVIIFCVAFFLSFIPFTIGAILLDETSDNIFGIILIILGGVIFIGSIVWVLLVSRKLMKQINQLRVEHNRGMLSKREFKNIFKTTTDEEVEFLEEYFTVNGEVFNYSDFNFAAGFNSIKLEIEASITIFNDSSVTPLIIPLDLDLIEEIENKKIKLVNKEELDFYIDNFDVAYKQTKKLLSFHPVPFLVMEFIKNKEDGKKFGKRNLIRFLISTGLFVLFLAFNILIMWLGGSETGVDFSNKIDMDIIVKVIFSIILILLIFVKSSKFHIISKASIALYLVLYWLGIFYFPGKLNVVVEMIFAILFFAIGFNELYRNKDKVNEKTGKKEEFNRFFGIGGFSSVLLAFNALNFTLVDEGLPFLIGIIIAGIMTIITIVGIILYMSKHKDLEKKQKISIWTAGILCPLVFGFLLSSVFIINLNYALDFNEPEITYYEVIELEKGDEESDKAVIVIDGKEVEISISVEEYYDLAVGDMLKVHYNKGAFNMPYFYHIPE